MTEARGRINLEPAGVRAWPRLGRCDTRRMWQFLRGMLGRVVQRPRARLRRGRLWSIADMPAAEIGRIVGVVRAIGDATVVSPITERPCLYYSVRVHDYERTLAAEVGGVAFDIEDGTGVARVDPRGAMSALAPMHLHNGLLTAPTQRQVAFLEAHGYTGTYLNVNYDEAIVKPGDRIAVLGVGTRVADTDGRSCLQLASSPDVQLVLGDDRRATRVRLPGAKLRRRPGRNIG